MTNEQLTQEFLKLSENQAKYEAMCIVEKETLKKELEELKKEIRETKELTESVHIMAFNIQQMQETIKNNSKEITEVNNKVEELVQKDYNNYIDTKKEIKEKIISGFTGGIITAIIGIIGILVNKIMKGE